jgi:hypothetical protein
MFISNYSTVNSHIHSVFQFFLTPKRSFTLTVIEKNEHIFLPFSSIYQQSLRKTITFIDAPDLNKNNNLYCL